MFVPNSFTDGVAGGTPITAATLNNLENGLVAADITNPASAAALALVAGYETIGLSAATKTALSNTYGRAMNLESYAGVDPTGVTECSAAIQAALNAAATAGVPLIAAGGQYAISSTITISADADLSRAVFNYTGTGTAIIVGNPPASIARKTIKTPYVIALTKTVIGWGQVAGSIGVKIVNTSDCTVHVGTIRNFESGLMFYGQGVGGGVTYSRFFLGTLLNNKRNLVITTDNISGYANQCSTFGGAFNFDAAEGVAVAGTRHMLLANVAQVADGWTFHEPSLEDSGGTCQTTIECWGIDNLWDHGRYETAVGVPSVLWQAGAIKNEIRSGVNVDAITEGVSGTTTLNKMTRSGGMKVITAIKTFDNTDEGKVIIANIAAGGTCTLPAVAYRSPGTRITVKNVSATTITINTAVDPMDGGFSVNLVQWASKTFVSQQLPSANWITV